MNRLYGIVAFALLMCSGCSSPREKFECGKEYPQYYKSIMHGQLLDVLNSF